MPADMLLAGDNVNGVFQPGFLCYGIPIGSDDWCSFKLAEKVREVAQGAMKSTRLLGRDERQGLWTVLRGSLKFQFEYWLGRVYPSLIREAARGVDRILLEVLEAVVGQHIPMGDSIVEQDNLHMETCHFDPKEDKFLAQKQGCIFEKIKIC